MVCQGGYRWENLIDMFGVLDKVKASLPGYSSSIIDSYDTIKRFDMEVNFCFKNPDNRSSAHP